jgi:hypothetical protein
MQNDIDDLIEAVKTIADTDFDAAGKFGANRIAKRPSLSATKGFYRPGERAEDGAPFTPTTTIPKYNGSPSGRAPTGDEKLGARQLQAEYLAGRLGKNEEENSRNWNAVMWIDKHYRVVRTPAEALPPLNIYVGDKISQSTEGTGAPTGPDDESPDEVGNEGIEFESINVGEADSGRSMCVMDEDGTTRRLEVKTDDYNLLRLMDDFDECDDLAKIDVNDLMREAMPLLSQTDFPSSDQRAESGKIIRMLILGMRSLWHPVKHAIIDHADMKSLGQGKGKDVAAAVGRQRVIEGLRLAESIRKGLTRPKRRDEASYWPALQRWQRDVADITKDVLNAVAGEPLPMPVRAPEGHYWNQAAGPVIKLADNDNCRFEAVASKAA